AHAGAPRATPNAATMKPANILRITSSFEEVPEKPLAYTRLTPGVSTSAVRRVIGGTRCCHIPLRSSRPAGRILAVYCVSGVQTSLRSADSWGLGNGDLGTRDLGTGSQR